MSSASRKILSEPSPSSPTHHAPGAYFEKPSGSKPTSPTSEPSSGVVVQGSATDGYCAPLDDRFWALGAALAPFLPKPKPAAGAARQSATTSFILVSTRAEIGVNAAIDGCSAVRKHRSGAPRAPLQHSRRGDPSAIHHALPTAVTALQTRRVVRTKSGVLSPLLGGSDMTRSRRNSHLI